MELSVLQHYWWIIISLLGGALTFLLFVQGGQGMLYQLGKTEEQRDVLVNALGHKWEYTFTTLVVFGGGFFASFPLFYSTSFGGAYVVWILILFSFVIQAVSFEYRKKPNNFLGKRTYEAFLQINGYAAPFLIGAAVATFFTGSPFRLNDMMQVSWDTPWRGVDALFNPINYLLAFSIVFLSRTIALMYVIYEVKDDEIEQRARKMLLKNAIPMVVFLVLFIAMIMLGDGFAVESNGSVKLVKYKYFTNLLEVPLNSIVFLGGIILVLYGIITTFVKVQWKKGVWFSGLGTILTVIGLLGLAAYNNTAFYPSYTDLNSSLTLTKASSSHYTLTVMSWVSLLVPFVMAYMIYAWRAISKGGISIKELNGEENKY